MQVFRHPRRERLILLLLLLLEPKKVYLLQLGRPFAAEVPKLELLVPGSVLDSELELQMQVRQQVVLLQQEVETGNTTVVYVAAVPARVVLVPVQVLALPEED